MNTQFNKFLELSGSVKQASLDLDIHQVRVSQFKHGRPLSKSVAKKIVDLYPRIDLYKLLYGDAA